MSDDPLITPSLAALLPLDMLPVARELFASHKSLFPRKFFQITQERLLDINQHTGRQDDAAYIVYAVQYSLSDEESRKGRKKKTV